jgi:HEAT repeat protein
MRRVLAIALLLAVATAASAQDENATISIVDQSREVLFYGIDSEVLDLIDRLEAQSEDRLDAEILQRYVETRNATLRVRILRHFLEREVPVAGDAARELLLSDRRLGADELRVTVRYLSQVTEDRSPELLERYREIAEDDDLVAASVAIEAIGTHGGTDSVPLLLSLYDELENVNLQGAIIRALGEASAVDAVDLLTDLATDPFEESSLRQYAAESLGRIAQPESLDVIVELLEDDDSLLRAYATGALGYFRDARATSALIAALRDSFWRVRVAALNGIAEQKPEGVLAPVLYKAEHDPESPVRQAALQTLSALGSAESYDALREIAANTRRPLADRLTAVDLVIRNDVENSLETVQGIITEEWDVEGSRMLDTVARALVSTGSPGLSAVYERLLSHPNFIIRIYAIRGIGTSGLAEFGAEIQRIESESSAEIIRSNALATLDSLGIEPLPDEEDSDGAGASADDEPEEGEAP